MQKADAKTDQTMEEQTGDVPAAVVCVSTTTSDQVELDDGNPAVAQAPSNTAVGPVRKAVLYSPVPVCVVILDIKLTCAWGLESSVSEQRSSRLSGLERLKQHLGKYMDLRSFLYRQNPPLRMAEHIEFLKCLGTVCCAPIFHLPIFRRFEILLGENSFQFVTHPVSSQYWYSWHRLWNRRMWLMHLGVLVHDPWVHNPVYQLPLDAYVPNLLPAGSGQHGDALTLMELPRDIHCLIFGQVQLNSSKDAMNMMLSSRYWMQLGRSELRHINMKELGLSARTQALMVIRLPNLESAVNVRLPTSTHLALFLRCLPNLRVLECELDVQWPDVLDCSESQHVIPKDMDRDMPLPRSSGLPMHPYKVPDVMRPLVDRRLSWRLQNIRPSFVGPLPRLSSREAITMTCKSIDYLSSLCQGPITLHKLTLNVCTPRDDVIRLLTRVLVPGCLRELRLIGRMEDMNGVTVNMSGLTGLLAAQSRLEVLQLECGKMDNTTTDVIANLPHLKTLRLHHCFIFAVQLLKLSRSPHLRQTLTELSLLGSAIVGPTAAHAPLPPHVLQQFAPRVGVDSSFLFGGGTPADDYTGPQGLVNVRVLNLRSVCNMTVICEEMAAQLPHLVSVDIRDIKPLPRQVKTAPSPLVINPAAFFSHALCPALEELSCDQYSKISMADLPGVLKNLSPNLRTLRLSGGKLTNACAEELVKQCPNLRTLDLSFNVPVSNKVFKPLHELSQLTYLNVRCAGTMAGGITDAGVLALLLPHRRQDHIRIYNALREGMESDSCNVEQTRLMIRQMTSEANANSPGHELSASSGLSALDTLVLGSHPLTPLSLMAIAVFCPDLRFLRIGRWSLTVRTLRALFAGCPKLQDLAVEMPPVRLALVEDVKPYSIDPLQYRNSMSDVLSNMINTKSVLSQQERDSLDVNIINMESLEGALSPLVAAEYSLQQLDAGWDKKVQAYIEERCAPFTSVLRHHELPTLQELMIMKKAGLLRLPSESPSLAHTTAMSASEPSYEPAAAQGSPGGVSEHGDVPKTNSSDDDNHHVPKRRRVQLDDQDDDDDDDDDSDKSVQMDVTNE